LNRQLGTNSRILLTGAAGFIGSAVSRLATERGHAVLGLVRPEQLHGLSSVTGGSVEFIAGRLNDAPWSEIRRFRPDVCVHAAWISTPGRYLDAPENNSLVTLSSAFLERAADAGVGFALVLGTCIEYGMTGEKLKEKLSPIAPASLYARSKNELRELLEVELPRKGVGLSWGRVFYPYGLGEHPQRLCSSLFAKLSKGEEVLLKTPNSIKDFIYITDLAAAILTLVENRKAGVVNLGTGQGTSVLQLARMIGKIVGRADLVREASETAPDPYPYVVADAGRLRSLGWEPKVNMEQGTTALIQSLQGGTEK
jgi:nucleoside-diphosphate-sugar epimerase